MINKIFTSPEVNKYLEKHNLIQYFKKSVQKLKNEQNTGLDFKKREPKSLNIWSFRITKKYRAWCKRENDILKIYLIDDHQ
ncbi:hypothetical protein A2335_00570 [Candidatus Peregrinibacteria bacterium RIFOXYB2_FULL_32_7]|nr:MAG: hypothetical protein A2335_00570 [Candidatus Peregrinibacteria bacterium RIFOXYB2_FULL_32_7]